MGSCERITTDLSISTSRLHIHLNKFEATDAATVHPEVCRDLGKHYDSVPQSLPGPRSLPAQPTLHHLGIQLAIRLAIQLGIEDAHMINTGR